MSKRQLEQIRQTLDSIVEDLCDREQAVDQEHAQLQSQLTQLDQHKNRVETLEGLLEQHRMAENDLASKLDRLIAALDEKNQAQPDWDTFDRRLTAGLDSLLSARLEPLGGQLSEQVASKLAATAPPPPAAPTLAELAGEIERIENEALGTLTERLSASLQTAMSVQLAPLSDELPDRLAAVVASATKSSAEAPPFTLPEFVRELEKFEARSMASLAARMTAGLQTAVSAQLASLTEELPQKIAAAVAAAVPRAAAPLPKGTSAPFSDPEPGEDSAAMSQELDRVRHELAETEALLAEALEQGTRCSGQVPPEMAARLDAAESDRDRLKVALAEQQAELTRVRTEAETGDGSQEQNRLLVDALRSEVTELRSLLAAKEYDSTQLEELRAEVARLRDNAAMGLALDSSTNSAQEEELRDRLDRATCEIVDLRTQNEDLAEQVARLQAGGGASGPIANLGQEGMSWEERKRLLLQQLDAEQEDGTPQAQAKRLEINDILRTTEAELARRDREIAELRSLVQQQSDARQGMAVGAAAVAQLIESDELVQQEREKLRAIQKTWDEKLRQAEIDLSMERAKLARERLQLEEQKHKLEEALQSAHAAAEADGLGKPADVKGRKWLSRLGLKEEG
jgi:chromosome segregation ATPase